MDALLSRDIAPQTGAVTTPSTSGKLLKYSLLLSAALNGVIAQGCGTEEVIIGDNAKAEPVACQGLERKCDDKCMDIEKDPANCGACGTKCEGTTPVCSTGVCTAGCKDQFADCSATDGKPGCTDLSTDRNNCDGCGNVCSQGQDCVPADPSTGHFGNCVTK
jgi:hypothetical protein